MVAAGAGRGESRAPAPRPRAWGSLVPFVPMSPEILIVAGIVVLLFGGSQLPKLARSLGQAKREFEGGQHEADTPAPAKTETPTETKAAEAKADEDKA
jgi:sec-independent protein translocase protein TatA